MFRRQRAERELAGWQCAAGRALLHMETPELAKLAGTTKHTIQRFENGAMMPRPPTVLAIEVALRNQGVRFFWDKRGEPKGLYLSWQAYARAYPGRPKVSHRRPEEVGAKYREHPGKIYPWRRDRQPPEVDPPRVAPATAPSGSEFSINWYSSRSGPTVPPSPRGNIAILEAQVARIRSELARLKEKAKDESSGGGW